MKLTVLSEFWAGIVGECFVGPYVWPHGFSVAAYRHFLQHIFPELSYTIPSDIRRNIWYIYDSTSAHFSYSPPKLHWNCLHWAVDRGQGPISWPDHSPDVNPLTFPFWGHLRNVLYASAVDTAAKPVQRAQNGCTSVCKPPAIVGFEVFTAVVMRSSIFWNTMPCSLLKANRRFGGTCNLHLQVPRKSRTRNQHDACSKQTFTGLHGGISQEIELFVMTFHEIWN
jgi:hypothetical protein